MRGNDTMKLRKKGGTAPETPAGAAERETAEEGGDPLENASSEDAASLETGEPDAKRKKKEKKSKNTTISYQEYLTLQQKRKGGKAADPAETGEASGAETEEAEKASAKKKKKAKAETGGTDAAAAENTSAAENAGAPEREGAPENEDAAARGGKKGLPFRKGKDRERGEGLAQRFVAYIARQFPGYFSIFAHFIAVYLVATALAFLIAAMSVVAMFYIISVLGLLINLHSIRKSWPVYKAAIDKRAEEKEEARLAYIGKVMKVVSGELSEAELRAQRKKAGRFGRKKGAAEDAAAEAGNPAEGVEAEGGQASAGAGGGQAAAGVAGGQAAIGAASGQAGNQTAAGAASGPAPAGARQPPAV
jgi:hypothetical protein